MKPTLSFDIEEWFNLLDMPCVKPIENWDDYELRAELIVPKILKLLDENKARATFFILGWLAERRPGLVEQIAEKGHEIASHGYSHTMVHQMTPTEFDRDLRKSKRIIENITNSKIKGFRAPGFTITKDSLWAFDILVDNGFEYDSSVFPSPRMHGFLNNAPTEPYLIQCQSGDIIEFPQSVVDFRLFKFSFFGGGYFRLAPYQVIRHFSRRFLQKNAYLNLYLHPRDFDIEQPKFDLNPFMAFRYYVNVSKTWKKMQKLLKEIPMFAYCDVIPELKFDEVYEYQSTLSEDLVFNAL